MVVTWTKRLAKRGSNGSGRSSEENKEPSRSEPTASPPDYEVTGAREAVDIGPGDVRDLVDIEENKTTFYGWVVPAVAGIGGALFGYDTGTVGHVLPRLNSALVGGVTTSEKALNVAMASVGAFIGGLLILLADKYGRKAVMYLSATLYIIGAVLQATARSVPQMVIARSVVGLSIGGASAVSPLYIGEVAPAKSRGTMTGTFNLAITGTQLVGYGIGVGLGDIEVGWRVMTGIGAGLALLWLCLLPFCPESPRYLITVDRRKAKAAVQKLRSNATPEQIDQHVAQLHTYMEYAKLAKGNRGKLRQFGQLFNKENRWKTFAACGLMALSQLSGFNSLMYFAPTLLVALGFPPPTAVAIPGANLLFTAIYMYLVDRVGRRRLLLSTSPIIFISLAISAVAWEFNKTLDTSIADDLADEILAGMRPSPPLDKSSFIILGSMVGMVVGYAGAIGNLAWTSSEFFPVELRAHGTMLMNMFNWGPNVLVSGTFLPLFEHAGAPATAGLYAGLSGLGTIFAYFFYPEVKGLPLEVIKEIFDADESPVKAANRKQRELKEARKNRGGMAEGENIV
ncbi:general substrate transporter [Cadophora sp. MPI-SDFR-AT-0126]|nr:general substrate transporter [Leotiomycetes sp. MPI-SDFR-AT-0126]